MASTVYENTVDCRGFLQFMAQRSESKGRKPSSAAPQLIQKLLWHSRQMDVADGGSDEPPKTRPSSGKPVSSGMTDTYRRFNNAVHHHQSTRRLVDVTTFFDSEMYKRSHSKKSNSPGSLALVFGFYSKITSSKKKLLANKLSFTEIQRASNSITFAEMINILRDFKVLPRLLSKQELQKVWQGRTRDESNIFYRELTYHEFVDCLARCALLAFAKLGHGSHEHSDEMKVQAFIKYLGLDSMSFIRNKLRTAGRATAGRLNYGVSSETNERLHLDRHDRRAATNLAAAASASSASALASYTPKLTELFAPYHVAPADAQWKCYKAPFIDMGTVLRNKSYRFKVELCNRSSYILEIAASLPSGAARLRGVRILPGSKKQGTLAPGLTYTIELEANLYSAVAEKCGALTIEINSLRNMRIAKELIHVPLYMNVSNPGSFTASTEGKSLLPHKEANLRPASAPCRFSQTSKQIYAWVGQQSSHTSETSDKRRPYTASMNMDRFRDGR
jgi:hypothetical protein